MKQRDRAVAPKQEQQYVQLAASRRIWNRYSHRRVSTLRDNKPRGLGLGLGRCRRRRPCRPRRRSRTCWPARCRRAPLVCWGPAHFIVSYHHAKSMSPAKWHEQIGQISRQGFATVTSAVSPTISVLVQCLAKVTGSEVDRRLDGPIRLSQKSLQIRPRVPPSACSIQSNGL